MIQVSSTIKLSDAALAANLTQAAIRALGHTAEALHTEVVQAQVVPRRDGALQNESFFCDESELQSGKVSLVHATPYARRLYFHPEYNFHREPWEEVRTDKDGKQHRLTHEGNPNAKGKWFEDWAPGGSKADFLPGTFAFFLRKEMR